MQLILSWIVRQNMRGGTSSNNARVYDSPGPHKGIELEARRGYVHSFPAVVVVASDNEISLARIYDESPCPIAQEILNLPH